MANAPPQAIGAQASQPHRQVVALAGDGGLAMLLGDLLTLRQNRLPVKVIVFSNGALSFVELEMKAAGIVTFGTDLTNPDFAAIASAAGLLGLRVDGEPAASRGRVTPGTPAGRPAARRSARRT
jgi:pyruvate dehydrogenase (quinone)